MITRFAVTGGRDFADSGMVERALSLMPADAILVHGAARGADTLCATYWEGLGRETEAHPADWKKYQRAAGPMRNRKMLNSGIQTVISFPGGQGTAHMTRICETAGIPVIYAAEVVQ